MSSCLATGSGTGSWGFCGSCTCISSLVVGSEASPPPLLTQTCHLSHVQLQPGAIRSAQWQGYCAPHSMSGQDKISHYVIAVVDMQSRMSRCTAVMAH